MSRKEDLKQQNKSETSALVPNQTLLIPELTPPNPDLQGIGPFVTQAIVINNSDNVAEV